MEETRVGVFVCHCGTNIGGVLDVPAVVECARMLPYVAHAEDNLYSCSEEGLSSLKQSIREHHLNRVVVASCTPRTHERLFKDACEEAGLNRYLFEFVNIREHCSWIHSRAGEAATEKAKRLIRMGVAKACLLEPQEEAESEVIPAALVIGGGIAGMTAALNLAHQGFRVHLVEKEAQLGGRLPRINRLCPTDEEAAGFVEPMIQDMEGHRQITLYMPATVKDVGGYVGNFQVTVAAGDGERTFDVGTIIVATGADVLQPAGMYGYGQFPNVLTQLELEEVLVNWETGKPVDWETGELVNRETVEQVEKPTTDLPAYQPANLPTYQSTNLPNNVVMINCVGSRIPERPYCSRVCCMTSIKNATRLKRRNPESHVYVLHRDLLTYGVEFEQYYRRAMETGVRFLRYELEHPPQVVGDGCAEEVVVWDALRGQELRLPVDLVVLTTPLIPGQDNETISRLLKVPLGESGFFLEAHVKLRPVEFATDGIYVCGTARWPADVSESVSQAYAASSKAAIPMRAGVVTAEAITAFSDPARCMGCGTCVVICPYGAIELQAQEDGRPFGVAQGRQVAWVNVVQCKGCGGCVAACPNGAMQQRGFTDQQVLRMLEVCAMG
ncbi:MAG: CoB--CoM heterodisulfide reductase iron-sulfur subunit A family protein [Chloroflexi bacterium]|nr:CoB--CoM heterodisulfide reductase iron-sulfur subunit A family protein [Chloroflexota bacterium]